VCGQRTKVKTSALRQEVALRLRAEEALRQEVALRLRAEEALEEALRLRAEEANLLEYSSKENFPGGESSFK